MIAKLTGILDDSGPDWAVIDVNGVGYKVFIPTSAVAKLPKPGANIKIFTYQVVREDAIELYGFLRKEERRIREDI